MKYTYEQHIELNEIIEDILADRYFYMYRDGGITLDDSYNLSQLKTIVRVIEEFDKEQGIS